MELKFIRQKTGIIENTMKAMKSITIVTNRLAQSRRTVDQPVSPPRLYNGLQNSNKSNNPFS